LNIDPNTSNFKQHPRTQQVLKTIEYFLRQGARIVVISHLSQSDKVCRASKSIKAEIVRRFKKEFSEIGNLIKFIGFSPKESAESKPNENQYLLRVKKSLSRLKNGHGLFLENVRLLPSEQNENQMLMKSTLELFDFFIHDGFGVCHRAGQFSAEKLFKNAPKVRSGASRFSYFQNSGQSW
jgi:3-phosphoglycerate kinase